MIARSLVAMLAFVAAVPLAHSQEKAAKPIFEKTGELTEQDPLDKVRAKSYSKVHEVKLEADKAYKIDLTSKDFDTFLRLEAPNGKMIGMNDDAGPNNTNSRLLFKCPKEGEYRLIVTTFPPTQTGAYKLTVTEPTKHEMLMIAVQELPRLPAEERTKVLDDLLASYKEKGKALNAADGGLAIQIALRLEGMRAKGVADWCTKFSKALEASENDRVKNQAKALAGVARRLRLPGNTMEITGTLLDGKKIDWASYRGKVVLVDFWATWCGPCVQEVPNIKKMYKAYHDKGFDVVGISLDRDGEAPAKFMEKRELPWACIFEKDAEHQPLADYYGIMAIPQAILVDKEGKVISMNARGPELARLLEQQLGPIPEAKTEEKNSE